MRKAEGDYGGAMPDNNVAETAWSPPGLPCLSMWSHVDDVTAHTHMCCAGEQRDPNMQKPAQSGRQVETSCLLRFADFIYIFCVLMMRL